MPFQFVACSKLPTQYGNFDISVFEDADTGEEHVALSLNVTEPSEQPVLLRLHSECLTGDAFGSLRCDCGPQLQATMQLIQKHGRGIILYLRQEGRGIGLPNKIRAYALQDQGHDTLDANLMLGLPADGRTYEMCKTMLDHFAVKQINLITNNPAKQKALQDLGFYIAQRTPLHVGYNPFNAGYISTKRARMGHLE